MIGLSSNGIPVHESYVLCVHGDQAVNMEYVRVSEGCVGPLCARLARLDDRGLDATVRDRAWTLCRQLDRALAARDLGGIVTTVESTEGGAVVVEFNAPGFLLFFTVEPREDDSGWGLATHRSSGGLVAGGPLSKTDFGSVLGLIVPHRRTFLVLSSEELSSSITVAV
ncbi:MAG: hypothetical protein JNL28_13515 [Planctomycetes bacterium]|nr:hypothetical protein [Planctomycetota bacterium]